MQGTCSFQQAWNEHADAGMSEHVDDTGDSADGMAEELSTGLSIACPRGIIPAL